MKQAKMKLIRKIKSYFIKYEFYSWKGFSPEKYDIRFQLLDDETLLDIGNFIKGNLAASEEIGNNRHRLKEKSAIPCEDLDELLPLIRHIVQSDYRETFPESIQHHWDFQYVTGNHTQCPDTICISNALQAKSGSMGNCVYPLATIRKYQNTYFCWNHLE